MQTRPLMQKMTVPMIALIPVLIFSPWAHGQARLPGAVYDFDRKGEKPGPAPRRDISGIWEPANGVAGGNPSKGAPAPETRKTRKTRGKHAPGAKPPVTTIAVSSPHRL